MPQELINFFNNKNINNDFIRNLILEYVTIHVKIFGNVISFDEIIDRLNDNLNFIVLVNPSKSFGTLVGQYEGFDKNTITMYFIRQDLESPLLREEYIKVFFHELTHSIYTIKQEDKSEKQIFGTYIKLDDGTTPIIDGNFVYMEAIVNYVASQIYGKKNGIYPAQTSNITKLANLLDKEKIIRSAFDSEEENFKKCFSALSNGAYEYFTEGMSWLNTPGTYSYHAGSRIMTNFFQGIIPVNVRTHGEFKNLDNKIKPLNIKQVSFEHDNIYKRQ